MRTPFPALRSGVAAVGLAFALTLLPGPLHAETGYDLWLRYAPLGEPQRSALKPLTAAILVEGRSKTAEIASAELRRGLRGLLGAEPRAVAKVEADGTVIVGTPKSSPVVAGLGLGDALASLGPEGFVIRSTRVGRPSGDGDRLRRRSGRAPWRVPLPALAGDRRAH